jgi:hypothetical protein
VIPVTDVQDMQDAPVQAPPALRRKGAERAARAVLPACAGAWTAAEIMHVTGVPWLDITLGSATVAALAYGRGARSGAKWLLAAGAWSALAAKLGPLAGPYLPLTDAWALLSFCGWRWARRHPDVVAARDKRQASIDWLAKRDRWGLSRTHLLDWEPTRLGERYVIDTRGSGRRASQVAGGDAAERIAEDELLPPSRVRIRRHRLAGRVEISVRHTDPWAKPIPHPVLADEPEIDLSGPYSIRQPAVVGQDPETGDPLELLLCGPGGGRNVSVVATIEGGKTVLLSCMSERVTKASDGLLFRINLSIKGDSERLMWAPACHLTALGPREKNRALKVLRVIAAIVEWRSRQPRTTADWNPSPEDPHLVLMIDEIDALTEIPACRQVLEHLASKGREFGVSIVRAGQRGTAEWTGGGNVRAVDGVFCLGKVNRSMEAMHAAGDLGLRLPDMSEYGDGHAGVWVIAEVGGGYAAGRSFKLSEPADVAAIVAERASTQPDLKPELKAFLGESYEDLLRTDVYARWARDRLGPAAVVAHPRPDMPASGASPAPAPVATMTDLDTLDRELDRKAEDYLSTLDETDPLRQRWLAQGRRNDETRRMIAETAAQPVPDISHDDQVAHAVARWRQLGEKTVIPDGHREQMLALLAAGKISAGKIAELLGVTPHTARCYVERLRIDGLARPDGKGRAAGWIAAQPPDGDDGQ